MPRYSVVRYGPKGNPYHIREHTASGLLPAGLLFFVLALIPAAIVWGLIRGHSWDRENRAAARASYEKMTVSSSLTRTNVKRDPFVPEWRLWRYSATIKITNTDSEPHLVSACVATDEGSGQHNCVESLPTLPPGVNYADKYANCIAPHATVTWTWRNEMTSSHGNSEYGKPFISGIDGVSLDALMTDHSDGPALDFQDLDLRCQSMPNG
jgi:hypothetical protein